MKSDIAILKELLELAKIELPAGNDMGYTMPDGKHHIYIYPDQEVHWDDSPAETFYVIEPNKVINGAHEPMDDTYITGTRDISEVIIGCQWCLEVFEADRQLEANRDSKEDLPDELIVRLAHEAGWMEAEGKIEVHSWEEIQTAIRDAIKEHSETLTSWNPFDIEDTIEKILLERFPSEPEPAQSTDKEIHILICTKETGYGIETQVSLHASSEEALLFADECRKDEAYDPATWNFDISSHVIDLSCFPSVPQQGHRVLSENPTFHSEQQSPDPSASERKKSLNDCIQSDQEKQAASLLSGHSSERDISR